MKGVNAPPMKLLVKLPRLAQRYGNRMVEVSDKSELRSR